MRNKILMTLALLLTAVTGAWAGEEPQLLTTINASSSFLTGSQTFDDIATVTFGGAGTIAFNNGWIYNWYKNGFRTADKKPVKNKELWEELYGLTKVHKVQFIKVKGHSDNELNNRCDEMAVEAANKFKD